MFRNNQQKLLKTVAKKHSTSNLRMIFQDITPFTKQLFRCQVTARFSRGGMALWLSFSLQTTARPSSIKSTLNIDRYNATRQHIWPWNTSVGSPHPYAYDYEKDIIHPG